MESLRRILSKGIHEARSSPKQFLYSHNDQLVQSALQSFVQRRPNLLLDAEHRVVYWGSDGAEIPRTARVRLITGGGSGHEPMHLGYVANGMIDAAVVGNVFASPGVQQIYSAIATLSNETGVILIVKNYTGDMLNFGLAMEKAKMNNVVSNLEMIVVGDDVALPPSSMGRRGLAGVILIHKIAGAAAMAGLRMDELVPLLKRAAQNMATFGFSLEPCTIPETKSQFSSDENEVILGSGVTSEQGGDRISPIPYMSDLIKRIVCRLINNEHNVLFEAEDEVIVLINNLGGMSPLELEFVANLAISEIKHQRNLNPVRLLCGTYCTALNNEGASITMLNVSKAGHEVLSYFDTPVPDCMFWPVNTRLLPIENRILSCQLPDTDNAADDQSKLLCHEHRWNAIIENIIILLESSLEDLTEWDTIAGDGDCGKSFLNGAKALLHESRHWWLDHKQLPLTQLLRNVIDVLEVHMGGTIGALLAIFLTGIVSDAENPVNECHHGFWRTQLRKGLETLERYSKARQNDRTIMDAVYPFVEEFEKTGDIRQAVLAAKQGAASTTTMRARFGRAAYVDGEVIMRSETPDAGASGISLILEGILKGLHSGHITTPSPVQEAPHNFSK